MSLIPTPQDLAALLGRTVSDVQALAAIRVVKSQVAAYVRGVGFVDGEPNDELAYGVIVPAALRLLAHPRQLAMSEQVGPQAVQFGGVNGFTVSEMTTMNRYRSRAR